MRYLFIMLLFIAAGSSTIHAQEKDTRDIFPNRTVKSELKTQDDSLKIRPNQLLKFDWESPSHPEKIKLKPDPLLPDYRFDDYSRQTEGFRIYFGKNKRNNNSRFSNFTASYSRYIIPTAMISYGILTRNSESLRSFDQSIHEEVCRHINKSYTIDNYLQYAPTMAIFAFDLAGLKAKHNLRDRAFVTATSYIIMDAAVNRMKDRIDVLRPDASNNRSFPSGHTATAFVGAHILFREYKDTSPWVGMSGYAVATATGALRIVNKRHWFSDVITGAGIGILSAEIGYLLLPVFHKILGVDHPDKGFVIAPSIGNKSYGVGLAYTF